MCTWRDLRFLNYFIFCVRPYDVKIFEDCGDEKELETQVSGSTAGLSSPGIFTSLNEIWLTKIVIRFFNACDVTLSVYPHRASLKNMPVHGVNRTYDLWNTSPMLCILVPRASRPHASSVGPGTHRTGTARKLALISNH